MVFLLASNHKPRNLKIIVPGRAAEMTPQLRELAALPEDMSMYTRMDICIMYVYLCVCVYVCMHVCEYVHT